MSVFRELTFGYNGDQVSVVPSLALLRRIKARGINNVVLANKCVRGGVDVEDLAIVHSEFMAEAGREISEEESYLYLTGPNAGEVQEFQMAYCQAVLPGVDLGKKPEAPAPKRKARAKAKPKT